MDIQLFLIQMALVLFSIALGYVIGLLQGGINIYTDKKTNKNEKQEYNSSYLEEVPEEMRLFVEQNKGQYK